MSMTKRKKALAGVSICAALGIGATAMMGMASPGSSREIGEDEAVNLTIVETATPHYGSIVVSSSLVGTVEPGQQVLVYPKTSGEVVLANYAVGDTVEAGAVLFEIDSTNTRLQIAQQQAAINSKQAANSLQLEQIESNINNYNDNLESGYNQTIVNAENAVQNAEAALQSANANLRAARTAYNEAKDEGAEDSTLTSLRNSRVQMELAVEQAQLNLEQAEQALELAKRQVDETIESNDYSKRSAEISGDTTSDYLSLQQLQNTLADHTVTAPISGVIEQKNVEEFNITSTQSVAYIISNKDAATVTFKVSESALAHVAIGDAVTIEKDGQICVGTVSEISTMADAANGLYQVKATAANAPFEMRSGSTVKVYVDTQKAENELLLPIDAVYYDDGVPYVYLFENNTAKRVEIETGITDDDYVHVKAGISLADEVIITWSASLFDGAEVYLPGTEPVDAIDGDLSNYSEAGLPGALPGEADNADFASDEENEEAAARDNASERMESGDEPSQGDGEEETE